jgi:predicted transcriptional regulator
LTFLPYYSFLTFIISIFCAFAYFSNKEIAEKLYLSEGTVKNYVTGLLEKTGLRDRTQLAIYYIRNIE